MSYAVADGHDNEAGLVVLTPQCATPGGMKYPEITFYGSGSAEVNGFQQTTLVWTSISVSDYNTLRTQLGFTDVTISNEVTIRLLANNGGYTVYNATVIDLQSWQRTPIGRSDFRVLATKLEEI